MYPVSVYVGPRPARTPIAPFLASLALFAAAIAVHAQPPDSPLAAGAQWIAAQPDPPIAPVSTPAPPSQPLPIFRRAFTLRPATPAATLASASLSISGLGQFEASINGRNVTSNLLTPAWSDYRKRVYYDTYDVAQLIVPGENAIAVLLGNGMYNVQSPVGRYFKFLGSFGQPKLIAQLRLRFSDGSQQIIVSDGAWKTASGPIAFTSIYGGEDYDARLEQPGWDLPAFDDRAWAASPVVSGPGGELVPESIPPIVANDTYTPVNITHPAPGVAVYDLGQNFAGWPEIEVKGARGDSVKLIAGELLNANGLVAQRSAGVFANNPNFFTYTLGGGDPESWHPRFSYYGFRYVQVETTAAPVQEAPSSAPSSPQPAGPQPAILRLDGRFLHDDVPLDGRFTSSDDLLNRIHVLINRAMLANMVSVLTDCPHREKLGWLEQTHLAAASLMYNYGLSTLYAKIAADMRDAQLPNGFVPDIAPEFTVLPGPFRDSPEWGAAVILSPWSAYQFYGSLDLLRDQYDAMQRYAAYLRGKAVDHILTYGLGDWYDIGPGPPGISQLTSPGLVPTAVYHQSLIALVRIAALLGHPEDAATYASEAADVKTAFNARFFHPATGQYDTGSQTANAMPLVVGLVPGEARDQVLANLVADIRAHSNHVTAGDVGFHYVVRALTDAGRSDVLYDMLSRTDKPSYGDQLARGATTLTEAWDAGPNSSQDHFMLGHAEEWFYRGLAGIDFDLSRDRDAQIEIHPAVPGDLQQVSASFQSKLGRIESAWTRYGDTLKLEIAVPAGATATFTIPRNFSRSISIDAGPAPSPAAVPVPGAPVPTFLLGAGVYRIESHR